VSEILQLTIHDVESKNIVIVGKGNKRREVFIPDVLRDIWKEYLTHRNKKSSKLFTGQRGAINRHTVHKIIKRYAKFTNIDLSKAHAHVLRHMYGKNLADREVSIDTIADLLGHSNINITRIYTRKTKQELLDIVNKF
jgi:integrase/recombinase XerD